VNMDRNNDLRLSARSPRWAKHFEPEFGRGSWFEFEIMSHPDGLPRDARSPETGKSAHP
jgi:hypothetical protein